MEVSMVDRMSSTALTQPSSGGSMEAEETRRAAAVLGLAPGWAVLAVVGAAAVVGVTVAVRARRRRADRGVGAVMRRAVARVHR
jgi:hypothetical protein